MPRAKVQAGGILRKSIDQTWRTPKMVRDAVARYFAGGPWLDVCTHTDNPMGADRYFCGPAPAGPPATPLFGQLEEDQVNTLCGLTEPWNLPWWCSPPFRSAELRLWLAKLRREVAICPEQEGLLLLPANRTEEAWVREARALASRELWIEYPGSARGRVPFESSVDGSEVDKNPFGSWIWGYGAFKGWERRRVEKRWREAFGELGDSWRIEVL